MKVSVIIPVYNASLFLNKAIQSALNQPQTSQLILIDDKSTDDSATICAKWAEANNKITFLTNQEKKGSAAARNLGLNYVTEEYIAFLDADDYFLPGRFDLEEKEFINHPEIDGIARLIKVENSQVSDSTGLKNGLLIGPSLGFQKITTDDYIDLGNFSTEGLTFKKECLINSGKYDDNFLQAYDQDFNIRMIIHNQIYSINSNLPVAIYNIHNSNTIKNINDRNKYRRLVIQKILRLSIKEKTSLKFKLHYLTKYIEYDYLCVAGENNFPKKIGKIFLLPIFMYRLLSVVQY